MAPSQQDTQVINYLRSRGYLKAEQAFKDEINGGPSATAGNVHNIAQLAHSERTAITESPQVYTRSYEALRSFVLGSLDIFRPELLPVLLPAFVHSYLDLVDTEHRDEASVFLDRFSGDHEHSHPSLIRLLRTAKLKEHAEQSEELARWRRDKFLVRLTDRGWTLLLGWLQSASLRPSGDGVEDDSGRERILRLINEHVKVSVVSALALATGGPAGLESEGSESQVDTSATQLKLGVPSLDPKLDKEVKRVLRDSDEPDKSTTQETSATTDTSAPMTVDETTAPTTDPNSAAAAQNEAQGEPKPHSSAPTAAETLPYPPSFRVIDVRREVEKVREGRKRIRLGKDAFETPNADIDQAIAFSVPRESSKPSVCLFTLHDTNGCLTSSVISDDSTLLAAGFSESYIRLWNLKGHNLRALRSDYNPREVLDVPRLRKMRERNGSPTRKLIGHSGPVYSVSFDPVPGAAGPPRYMLSASQDGTVRLWSLDTYTTVAIYRGHRNPVWTVEWGPRGIYFATGSRDRTARLWTTDSTSALRIFAGHLSDVDCLKFHPNSLYLATGSSDRTCRIWDIQKGTCVRVLTGHRGPVTCLAFSPNGLYLASGSEDRTVNLWDIGSGKLIRTLTGHVGRVESVVWGAESTMVSSGGIDGSVRIWDADLEKMEQSSNSSSSELNGRVTKMEASDGPTLMDAISGPGGLRRSTGTGLPDGLAAMEASKDANGSSNGVKNETNGVSNGGRIQRLENNAPCKEHLAAYMSKGTPIISVRFTQRNLCLAIGAKGEP